VICDEEFVGADLLIENILENLNLKGGE